MMSEPKAKYGDCEQLKPCPFCGVAARIYPVEMSECEIWYRVGCPNECENSVTFESSAVAERVWNTRPIEDALQRQLEEANAQLVKANKLIEKLKNGNGKSER